MSGYTNAEIVHQEVCPFCGGSELTFKVEVHGRKVCGQIQCSRCKAMGPEEEFHGKNLWITREEHEQLRNYAYNSWNKRSRI